MSASLVGSEMCIRDSTKHAAPHPQLVEARQGLREQDAGAVLAELFVPVSYTHLTLPTICSV
eukprot:2626924-Alexandrium_andersonii.AAC.1